MMTYCEQRARASTPAGSPRARGPQLGGFRILIPAQVGEVGRMNEESARFAAPRSPNFRPTGPRSYPYRLWRIYHESRQLTQDPPLK